MAPNQEQESDLIPPATGARNSGPVFIVGIGASAGGLEALERFFERMPRHTGMAFVVVQHLSPDFKSLMDELLARRTSIPIHRVENGMAVCPDAIYLIPPKKDMILANGKLLLTDKEPSQTMPIDHFFRSLAQDAGEQAVAIVLSGTGSDGSRGVRDIHEVGGLVIVQSPETAKFDGMPKSSLETGVADFVLAPEDMPPMLADYLNHPLLRGRSPKDPAEGIGKSGMGGVFHALRDAYGIDFSLYKPNTVARRTERRLLLTRSADLAEYLQKLRADPGELNALYRDLLIGVTRFFRDPDAFKYLGREVLPPLLEMASGNEDFRVWVAGCATGEEAYSMAILLQETLDRMNKRLNVKVFATDVHRASLETAGAGIYSREALADLSPERLRRFFVARGEDYQVGPELRKIVVFAQHNLTKDAPFTRLDLITCRNLLIYFQPPAQKKVLSLFHFGLKTGGVLFLGPSESPGELAEEFEPLENHWKFYRKRREMRLPAEMRLPLPQTATRARPGMVPRMAGGSAEGSVLAVYDAILERYMPPSLLVNGQRQLIHSFAGAGRYLAVRDGRHSGDVLELVEADLRLALTGALSRAAAELTSVSYKGLRVQFPEGDKLIHLTVDPVRAHPTEGPFFLVRLEEMGTIVPRPDAKELDLESTSREHFHSLETELRYTKENLQATIEELETSNEELQAANEELVASNEELQSTNEELHSVNEELYTVNAEYQKKIAELTELTTDMENLLVSSDVHTIFLDADLCIRKFSPRIGEAFHLMPRDIGRRLDSFSHNLDFPDLMASLPQVLETGTVLEKQVRDRMGNWHLLRLLPYRAAREVKGVVLTLIDINNLKEAEDSIHRLDRQLSAILKHSPHLVFVQDVAGRYLLCDDSFKELAGMDPVGKTAEEIFGPQEAQALSADNELVFSQGATVESEVSLTRLAGPRAFLCVKFPMRDEANRIVGLGAIITDVTGLKKAEQEAREAVEHRDRFLAMLSHELRNPLAAIVNANAVIDALGAPTGDAREWFKVIERRSRHMARMLDDLLDVSRVTQNKIEIRKRAIDLRDTVPDTLEEVQALFRDRQVELITEMPEEPLVVEGDAGRLQQVQVNLLTNAARYTPVGGKVWYRLAREGDCAVARVRDTGAGLRPAMLERIFDLFVQVDPTVDRSHGGLGVGLTLVRSLVNMHGGNVEAFSEGPGKGSEFVVRLPLSTRPQDLDQQDFLRQPNHRALNILIVEDDPDVRESLRALLEMDGHHVRGVACPDEALKELETEKPDVALLDIGLPGMDGYSLCRKVRERYGHGELYLMALTGYGRATDRRTALEAGFDQHLTKPIRPRDLFRSIHEYARSRQNQAQPWQLEDGQGRQ